MKRKRGEWGNNVPFYLRWIYEKKKLNSRTKNSQISNTQSSTNQPNEIEPVQSDPILNGKKNTSSRTIPSRNRTPRSPLDLRRIRYTRSGGATRSIVYYWPPSTEEKGKRTPESSSNSSRLIPLPREETSPSLLNVDVVCRQAFPKHGGTRPANPPGVEGNKWPQAGHTLAIVPVQWRGTGVWSFSPPTIDISTMCTEAV